MFRVYADVDEAIRWTRGVASDQVPFALAASLTRVAKRAQSALGEALPLRFTIRRLAWAKQGLRVTPATKATLAAVIEDIHAYMELQESGGAKLPRFGKYLAVPLRGARANVRALIAPEDLPSAVMASGLGFIRGNIMFRAVFQRRKSRRGFRGVGGFSAGSWSREILPMYALVHQAKVPARYGFTDLVTALVRDQWPDEFAQTFLQALETRR